MRRPCVGPSAAGGARASISARISTGRNEMSRSWIGVPISRRVIPRRVRARSFARMSAPVGSSTNWTVGFVSNAESLSRACPFSDRRTSVEFTAKRKPRSRIRSRGTFAKIRWERSTVEKRLLCDSIVSAFPRKRKPPSLSPKWNRCTIRSWTSALKYMRVLRQSRRSIREIGASLMRSWRPKMIERRSSRSKT